MKKKLKSKKTMAAIEKIIDELSVAGIFLKQNGNAKSIYNLN